MKNKQILKLGKKLASINPTRFSSTKNLAIIGFVLLIVSLLLITNVSAYKLLCLADGQKLPPNLAKPRYVCEHDSCTVCVTSHYYPTDLKLCREQANCNAYNPGNDSGGVLDTKPPVLTVNSPADNAKYNSRYVLFNLATDETSSFYYTDNINGRGVFSRLAALVKSYSKSISFKDGLNNITIKAIDDNGNEFLATKSFYVDSTKPKITKTFPGKGFASGKFEVWFTEANPTTITLDYGNFINGRKTANIPISSCTAVDEKGKYYCMINVLLSEYNNQNIDYKFKVVDIVGNYVESKAIALKVDSAKPVVTNSPIYTVNGKYVTFKLNITEVNFDKVVYMDNTLLRPSWKSLCTSLKNNVCEKKITFSRGSHVVDVKVLDDAGNEAVQRVSFDIDY